MMLDVDEVKEVVCPDVPEADRQGLRETISRRMVRFS